MSCWDAVELFSSQNEAMRRSLEDLKKVKEIKLFLKNTYPICIRTFGFSIHGLDIDQEIIVQININKITKEKGYITEKYLIEEIINEGRNQIQRWGNLSDLIHNYNKTFNKIQPWLDSSISDIISNDKKGGSPCFWLCYRLDGKWDNEHKDHDKLPLGNLTKFNDTNDTLESLRESIDRLSKRVQQLESSNYMSNNSSIYH